MLLTISRKTTLRAAIAEALPDLPPEDLDRAVAQRKVTVNRRPVSEPEARLQPGDRVKITLPRPAPHSLQIPIKTLSPQRPPTLSSQPAERSFLARNCPIIYEDDDVIVVDKPIGMVTADPARASGPQRGDSPSHRQPFASAPGRTLFDLVKLHVRSTPAHKRKGSRTSGRVFVIHRLDKPVSGLVVFAKTEAAFRWLKEDLRSKRMHRIYIAVAEGRLGNPGHAGTHQSFLTEDDPRTRRTRDPKIGHRRFQPGPQGSKHHHDNARLAITHYRVLAVGNDRTLLQIRLDTGRKNQIRVHLSELGHPILGDDQFGARTNPIGRVALHAAELGFTHPVAGRSMRFSCPAPASFYRAVGQIPPSSSVPDSVQESPPHAAVETAWENVAEWYDQLLEGDNADSDRGNDHYENVLIPGTLRMLSMQPGEHALDIACGQGLIARRIIAACPQATVTALDASPSLIEAARQRTERHSTGATIRWQVADARSLADLTDIPEADAAYCVMALQNIDSLGPVMRGVATKLRVAGRFVAVISHPSFRVPGASSWGWSHQDRRQYRRVDSYLSAFHHIVRMKPGSDPTVTTTSFHRPLQAYAKAMTEHGLLIESIEEWPSLRTATSGPRAPEENRAFREIPLFMAIRARKLGR